MSCSALEALHLLALDAILGHAEPSLATGGL
jgi:hypothetical protein